MQIRLAKTLGPSLKRPRQERGKGALELPRAILQNWPSGGTVEAMPPLGQFCKIARGSSRAVEAMPPLSQFYTFDWFTSPARPARCFTGSFFVSETVSKMPTEPLTGKRAKAAAFL